MVMGIEHNTFICWSGEPSRHIARALRQWLPVVVQKSRPWMSEEDIGKGSSHFSEITQSLRQTRVGIICLTPQNLHSTWIHFEAGAIFNAIEGQHGVCTYLIGGIQPKDLFPPLNQFQATVSTKEDTRRLVKTVHKTLGSTVEDETLEMAFEANWPRMQA
ncbi:MAG TPA: toll/interleukin-1 receptor domain-containing protein, partial [Bryobacteraceae bacterium]|nr:toll/interleukin-1 receptor domain-containing protein [Bryobacteraceae bacterium]